MYKNIILFWDNGWQADYSDNGKRFALHRCCCRTKKSAYVIAKEEVDFLMDLVAVTLKNELDDTSNKMLILNKKAKCQNIMG